MDYLIMNQETLERKITKQNLQEKLFVNKTKSTSFPQINGLKIYQDITVKSSKQWLKLCKIQVSLYITTNYLS